MGRLALRAGWGAPEIEFVHINEIGGDGAVSAHLLYFDSVHGRWDHEVTGQTDRIVIEGKSITHSSQKDFTAVPWKDYGVDVVLESSGKFRTQEQLENYLKAGVKKVIVAAPVKKGALNIVMGVNDDSYDPANHHVISNASCTTNCLAPLVHVLLKEGFGIEEGLMTTVHSYTATQKTVDGPSRKDWKGGRSAAINIIPSTTGAAKAVGLVCPEVKGKLTGMAFRVPTPTVSVVDLTVRTVKQTSYKEITEAMKKASQTYLKGILEVTEDEVVSTDFIHCESSSIYDAGSGIELNNKFFKLVSWYDNEWGYSHRVGDLLKLIVEKGL